jgi:carbon-monoxide dehydrogenase small subunit
LWDFEPVLGIKAVSNARSVSKDETMARETAKFIINGMEYEVLIEPRMTLLNVLRDKLDLTGTKYGCGVAECGACTVLLEGKPIHSCSTLALTVRGKNIVTIEGLIENDGLHPVQQAFIDCGAVQCGYCTPGMIMTAKALLDENPNPSRGEVKEYLASNICRCTGYVKIIDAVLTASENVRRRDK